MFWEQTHRLTTAELRMGGGSPFCMCMRAEVDPTPFFILSALSPSSINLVPAQAGKVIVDLAWHWLCVTKYSGISTYDLTAYRRAGELPPTPPDEYGCYIYLYPVDHFRPLRPFSSLQTIFPRDSLCSSLPLHKSPLLAKCKPSLPLSYRPFSPNPDLFRCHVGVGIRERVQRKVTVAYHLHFFRALFLTRFCIDASKNCYYFSRGR